MNSEPAECSPTWFNVIEEDTVLWREFDAFRAVLEMTPENDRATVIEDRIATVALTKKVRQ